MGCGLLTALSSLAGELWLQSAASAVVMPEVRCPAACGWSLHGPGIESVSPAMAGGFLTTGPPGKS